MKEENKGLRTTISELQLQLDGVLKGVSPSVNFQITDTTARDVIIMNVQKLGRNFGFFYNLFIDYTVSSMPRPVFRSTDPIRYATPENICAGYAVELYEAVPIDYYPIIFTPSHPGFLSTHWKLVSTYICHCTIHTKLVFYICSSLQHHQAVDQAHCPHSVAYQLHLFLTYLPCTLPMMHTLETVSRRSMICSDAVWGNTTVILSMPNSLLHYVRMETQPKSVAGFSERNYLW